VPPQGQFARPQGQSPAALNQGLPPPPPGTVTPNRQPAPPQSASAVKAPVVRAKIDDTPPAPPAPAWTRAPRAALASPEQLGVAAAGTPAALQPAAAPASVDWNATHARLRQLGAVGWQLGELPQGRGYRFTLLLPTAQPNCSRHVEATGATEAEAVRLALASAQAPGGR
jgi:hypothetical protein